MFNFQIKVTHHDNSAVPVDENTKDIIIGKVYHQYQLDANYTYTKFELDSTGSANIRIPTSTKQGGFRLNVSGELRPANRCHFLQTMSILGEIYG